MVLLEFAPQLSRILIGRMEKKMETTIVYRGLYMDNAKEHVSHYSILGLYRDMEKNMEATIVYWGYIGVMENKMEAIPKTLMQADP